MHNVLILDRYRYNSLRHNPLELVQLLDFFVVKEESGEYLILKNRMDTKEMPWARPGCYVDILALEEILILYRRVYEKSLKREGQDG